MKLHEELLFVSEELRAPGDKFRWACYTRDNIRIIPRAILIKSDQTKWNRYSPTVEVYLETPDADPFEGLPDPTKWKVAGYVSTLQLGASKDAISKAPKVKSEMTLRYFAPTTYCSFYQNGKRYSEKAEGLFGLKPKEFDKCFSLGATANTKSKALTWITIHPHLAAVLDQDRHRRQTLTPGTLPSNINFNWYGYHQTTSGRPLEGSVGARVSQFLCSYIKTFDTQRKAALKLLRTDSNLVELQTDTIAMERTLASVKIMKAVGRLRSTLETLTTGIERGYITKKTYRTYREAIEHVEIKEANELITKHFTSAAAQRAQKKEKK